MDDANASEPEPLPSVVPGGAAAAVAPTAKAGPVAPGERLLALDVLRGLALLGILMVNIFSFGLPLGDAFTAPIDGPPAEEAGFGIMRAFFQLKWMPIFSMLFGAGLAVQVARAAAREEAFVPRYVRRIVMLLLIGLVHALLLWYGDILVWYAVLGAGLLLVRTVAPMRLVRAGVVLAAIGGVVGGSCMGVSTLAMHWAPAESAAVAPTMDEATPIAVDEGTDPDADPDAAGEADLLEEAVADEPPIRGLDAILASQGDVNQPVWREAERAAYAEGPWIDAFWFRLVSWLYGLLFLLFGWGFIVFGCFMIGAGLLRAGFFAPERAALQGRVAATILLITVPLEIVGAIAALRGGVAAGAIAEFLHGLSGPAMAVGLLSGITWLVSTGRTRAWDAPVRAAGRAALSVYLGETIIATAIFQWWGLGLFGTVPRLQLLGIALLIWLALAVLAMAWLQVFRFGPVEWAWRSLTYGRFQPFLRRGA